MLMHGCQCDVQNKIRILFTSVNPTMFLIEDTSIMPVLCFVSSQLEVKCTETSCNIIFMTLWILAVNFIEYFIFISPLLGIFYVFYTVDCESEAYSVAHFSFTYFYLLTNDGRMKGQNVSWKIIINEHIVFQCYDGLEWIAND
jgi:hypothetical protein